MKIITMKSVDGTSIAMGRHLGLGLLTAMSTQVKSMDQEKKMENMSTQETVWEL